MRRIRHIAAAGCAALLLTLSCKGWLDGDYPFGQNRSLISNGSDHFFHTLPEQEEEKEERHTPHCYFSAVEFPQGYNWKRDSAGGQVPCRIVLFKDGDRILELAVRPDGPSADPDMHRIVGGHLYTDYCTAEETIVGKDGTELFRYPGRESLRGFCVDAAGKVHTLGQSRNGQGFSYRIDGEPVLSRSTGFVFGSPGAGPGLRDGALSRDEEGRFCFAFADGAGHGWIWQGGELQEVMLAGAGSVYDLRPVRGSPVAAFEGDGFYLMEGNRLFQPTDLKVFEARIVTDGNGDYRVAARLRNRDGTKREAWLTSEGIQRTYREYDGRMEHVLYDGQDGFVAMDSGGKVTAIRGLEAEVETVEAGRYLLISPACIWMDGEEAFVALSGDPDVGAGPQVWHGGEWLSILLNGYLTGITYE